MEAYAQGLFEAYEALVGRPETQSSRVPGDRKDGLPPVFAVFFDDWPEPGVLSAFTIGAGLGLHAQSLDAHVELVVSLRTSEPSWGLAVAFLTEQCRTHIELVPGTKLTMSDPIVEGSPLAGFLVTLPHHWPQPPRLRLAQRQVTILEARPIYPSEIAYARAGGTHQLLHALEGPHYDLGRPELPTRLK